MASKNFALGLLIVITVVYLPAAHAKSFRKLWIPEASAPDSGQCRFEAEQMFTPLKKSGDRPGQYFEHSIGSGCHVGALSQFDFDAGADYVEAYDMAPETLIDPLQGYVRATFGQRRNKGWQAALGVDGIGLKSGQNNHNLIYLMGQARSEAWGAYFGGYMGNEATLKKSDGSASNTGALIGIRRYIGRGLIGAEMLTGANRFGFLFFGAQVQFDEIVGVTAGYAVANDRSAMRDWLFLRLVFTQ